MASSLRTTLRRRLGVLVAGVVVVTVLTAAAAAAAPPGPMAAPAAARTRPGADPGPATGAGRPAPGFLLERGRFTPVVVPAGVDDPSALGIGPVDLNDRRQIVGSYDDVAADATRGFLLERGRFATVHVPGAMSSQAQGINNHGQIVGVYSDDSNAISAPDATRRGFVLDRGRYVRLDVPGARDTNAFDINDRGQVVGEYQDAAGAFHGYLWQRGRFRTIDVPGQPATTAATGINHRGQITGGAGPLAARSGSCGTGAASPPSRSPAPRSPPPSASTTAARSWATASAAPPPPTALGVPARRQGSPHRDQPARRHHHRGVRHQQPRPDRRVRPDRRHPAEPATHQHPADGQDGLTTGGRLSRVAWEAASTRSPGRSPGLSQDCASAPIQVGRWCEQRETDPAVRGDDHGIHSERHGPPSPRRPHRRCDGGPAGRRPRLGRPRQRPRPRSPGEPGPPPPGHQPDGDRPPGCSAQGSNDPQLGPRPTAGRPADAPGGLTLTPECPQVVVGAGVMARLLAAAGQARRASATATCHPHPGGRRRRIPGDDLSHDRQEGGAPAWCASPDTHIASVQRSSPLSCWPP